MSALERAQFDVQQGDLGSARMRLRSFISTARYSAEVCEMLARISRQMSDPVEAGRWYFLCDSADEEAAACIELFLHSCRDDARRIATRIPARVRSTPAEQFPEAVRERLSALPLTPSASLHSGNDVTGNLVFIGCLVLLTSIGVTSVIGAGIIIRWLFSLLV
jgi:hypothetical protein